LDDLNYKLEELTEKDAPYRGWERLTDNDIRYAIPEYFENIADVERAIELALEDLKNKYEIDVLEECYSRTCTKMEKDIRTTNRYLFPIYRQYSQNANKKAS